MAKTNPLNTSVPADTGESPRLGAQRIRELALAVAELLSKDHYIGASSPYSEDAAGEHAKITLRQATKPANAADKGFLYTKDVSGTTELFYEDEAGNEVKLTTGGLICLTSAAMLNILANNTYFTAKDAAGTGTVDLIKATTGGIPEIKVGAVLSADTAPAVDAGIANKKYVDTKSIVSVLTGTINHGETIPLPDGYTAEQCKWFVSWNSGSNTDTGYPSACKCSVNSSRVVTAQWINDGNAWVNGVANYMIIGVK